MKIKAVFFDRDNTLTYKNSEIINQYYKMVESISGKPYVEDKKKMFEIFANIKKQGFNTNTYQNEIEFYKQYYKQVLLNECGTSVKNIETEAEKIFNLLWLNDRKLFDEVIDVIKKLKSKNIKVGIISDTTHSLPYTLKALGIGNYIDAYTCSKEVGVMKPDPKIYLTALNKLNCQPSECLYVDDYEDEVVGAENLGILSFRIKRDGQKEFNHDIKSLLEIFNFID